MIENIAAFTIFIFILFFEFSRKKIIIFDLLTAFHFFFIVVYLLPYILIVNNVANVYFYYPSTLGVKSFSIEIALSLVLTYIFICIGFLYGQAGCSRIPVRVSKNPIYNIRRTYLFIFVVSGIGVLSLVLYVIQNGGLINTLATSFLVRTGVIESTSKFGFILRFTPLLEVGAFLALSYMLFYKRSGILFKWFYTFLLGFVIIWLMIKGGRGQVIWFILINLGIYVLHQKKTNIFSLKLISSFALVLLVIIFGKDVFALFQVLGDASLSVEDVWGDRQSARKEYEGLLDSFVRGYVHDAKHVIVSIAVSIGLDLKLSDYQLFKHSFTGLSAVFPVSILGVSRVDTISDLNTYYQLGEFSSVIPPGFIAYSFYSLGWSGVVIASTLFGFLGGVLNSIFIRLLNKVFCSYYLLIIISLIWTGFFTSGDPFIFFRARFILGLSLGALMFEVCKIKLSKQQRYYKG